jgi:NADPH-dependent curcumin reductase CurA
MSRPADQIPAAQRIVLAARPQGKVKPDDFRLESFDVGTPGPGEVLLRTRWLSLDPYMRGRMDDRASYVPPTPLGATMGGEVVAEVVASRFDGLTPGDPVLAYAGWTSHAVIKGETLRKIDQADAPLSTRLGVLGMPGFTAWSGMREIGKPKPGETVAVAAASGPVGSLVGQLARRAGARAVGIAGGPEKCRFLTDSLGFDAAIDHRAPDFPAALAAACPTGIDVYFENVGGAVWQAVLPLLNQYARVPVCGLIAYYNGGSADDGTTALAATLRQVLVKSLTLRGFINSEFQALYPDFLAEIGAALRDGRIHHREDVVEGLHNAPEAFMGLLEGRNFGKLLVKVA